MPERKAPPSDTLSRLDAIEEKLGILDTLHRYTHALDYGLLDEFLDVFTSDGVFHVNNADGTTMHRDAGHKELAAYIRSQIRPSALYEKHLALSPVIRVNGNEATVESYFFGIRNEDEGPVIHVYGQYHDRLSRESGRWRIKERIAQIESLRKLPHNFNTAPPPRRRN